MGSSPESAVPAYSRLRMLRKRPQVLGTDLNRSESGPQPACPRLRGQEGTIAASRVQMPKQVEADPELGSRIP